MQQLTRTLYLVAFAPGLLAFLALIAGVVGPYTSIATTIALVGLGAATILSAFDNRSHTGLRKLMTPLALLSALATLTWGLGVVGWIFTGIFGYIALTAKLDAGYGD